MSSGGTPEQVEEAMAQYQPPSERALPWLVASRNRKNTGVLLDRMGSLWKKSDVAIRKRAQRFLFLEGMTIGESGFETSAAAFCILQKRVSLMRRNTVVVQVGVLLQCAGDDDHATGTHHVVHAEHGANADRIDRGFLVPPDDPDDRPHWDVRTGGEVGLLGDDNQPPLASKAVDDPPLGRTRDDDADHGTAHHPAEGVPPTPKQLLSRPSAEGEPREVRCVGATGPGHDRNDKRSDQPPPRNTVQAGGASQDDEREDTEDDDEDQELPWKVEEGRMRPPRTKPQVVQRAILDEDVHTARQSQCGQSKQERHGRVLQHALEPETPCCARLQVPLLDLLKYLLLHIVVHTHPLLIVKTMVPDTKGFTMRTVVPDLHPAVSAVCLWPDSRWAPPS